jgi:lipocalin
MKRINFIAIIISLFASCTTLQKVNNETIDSLDLNRFLGEWYEIARFDHCFESGMENNKAVYTMGENGIVSVKNSGVKNGNLKEVSGIAKTTDNPGLLRVSFFKPFYADYRVLYLDADYQYALIGSASSDYLWILSRTPQLEDSAKEILLSEAVSRGYDINNFIGVKQ